MALTGPLADDLKEGLGALKAVADATIDKTTAEIPTLSDAGKNALNAGLEQLSGPKVSTYVKLVLGLIEPGEKKAEDLVDGELIAGLALIRHRIDAFSF